MLAALVCAACGLVYELVLVALGSTLVGSSITQTSVVISVVMCSMGIGSLVVKRFVDRPLVAFVAVEFAVAIAGGCSVPMLYAAFAWLDLYLPVMLLSSVVIGVLIGAEIPLLMSLVQRVRRQDASEAVADIAAADYVGALIGGLAFPFVLLPTFGLLDGALVTAAVNVLAAVCVCGVFFRAELSRRGRLLVRGGGALLIALLLLGSAIGSRLVVDARQALYDNPIVLTRQTKYQEITMTESPLVGKGSKDLRLYLNGDLQFSSLDEYRYHEALVHPAMRGAHRDVVVLGGGDGLAVREILKYPDVASVTLVELDPEMTHLARTDRRLVQLNGGSLRDPRVHVVDQDAFSWVRSHAPSQYDVAIVDFPDPDDIDIAKLYSNEMYGMTANLLRPGGRMVVQAGSPYFAADEYWCVAQTVASAGLMVSPYHVDVPTFGDWGFVLAAKGAAPHVLLADPPPTGLRFVDDDVLRAATTFGKDRDRRAVRTSTLADPVILEYAAAGWRQE